MKSFCYNNQLVWFCCSLTEAKEELEKEKELNQANEDKLKDKDNEIEVSLALRELNESQCFD